MSIFVTEQRYGPHTGTLISTQAFVATNVAVARAGWKKYRESELFSGGSSTKLVDVYTSPEQLFSEVTMASAEGKPVCLNHPWTFITPETWRTAAVGHMSHIRKSTERLPDGNDALVADVVVNEVAAINAVKSAGIRGTSLGYQCEYGELGNGTFEQRNILVNHLALVASPRTRNTRIEDSMEYTEKEIERALAVLQRVSGALANERHTTTDVDASERNATALASTYADSLNEAGARMRGRDCRSGLRRAAADAAPTPEVSPLQRLEAFQRSEAYAAECKLRHRK